LEYLFTIKRGTNYNKADDPVIYISRVVCPEGQTTQWTKEKGVIRGHKKKDRQPNEQKRKGSSEVMKRRTLMTPISFVYWVVCPSLYDI
jgi:hypothetical protein